MLRNVKDLRGYVINATDGVIGQVDDVYLDDEDWTVRYFVVDTGPWLSGRRVLISTLAIRHVDWATQMLSASLTKAQVERSPDIDARKPVSREDEAAHSEYYGYPFYWIAVGRLGRRTGVPADDSHLRSGRAVNGHHLHAKDGDIGHIEDLLVDDHTWAIRYLIVNTSQWLGRQHVLIAPEWIETVDWSEAKVSVDLTRQAVKGAPPYDPVAQLDRQREQGIYEHYGRPGYWTTKDIQDAAAMSAK
jgi:sporulation protein YlmC with PRC-barrel domain